MDTATAARIINRTAAKPGYRHEASAYFGDRILITVSQFDARNSSTLVNGTYPVRVGGVVRRDHIVETADLRDVEDVTYALVNAYLCFDAHETREFLRGPDGEAVFHPHTYSGKAAWERQLARPTPGTVDEFGARVAA